MEYLQTQDKRKAIWTLFPESYCENFPESPVNSKLNGENNWKIELEVKFEDLDKDRWIFTILPAFIGLQYHKKELFFTVTYEDGTSCDIKLVYKPKIEQQFKITVKHSVNRNLEVFINNELECTYKLIDKTLKTEKTSYVILNSLTEEIADSPSKPKVVLLSFSVYLENILKAKHNFKNFIYDKSVDETDNLNFLNLIQ